MAVVSDVHGQFGPDCCLSLAWEIDMATEYNWYREYMDTENNVSRFSYDKCEFLKTNCFNK